ncbi:uncharacterized protein LOC123527151 [Mercenaria mercenaria]|uniref:uncharacterized protein LOC123527151 n=1 Tax=Mercenaria mercenaria TaxID=6596 RepID=UPI00234F4227|nr:uncharacterized protein LOC123527151 [Mercenaria mercenaria]
MTFRAVILHLVILGLCFLADSRGKEDPYNYHIEAEHEALIGHISHDAEKGSRVIAEVEEVKGHGHEAENTESLYLKVLIQSVKTIQPLKHTSSNFDISMVTSPDRKITHDNTNAASNTFNHVPTHTARMTGNHVQSSHIPGVHSLPTQKFTSETRVVTTNEKPTSSAGRGVPVTTNTQTNGQTQDTKSHNVHLTTVNSNASPNANSFRNIIPHGHNIHITHLVHDPIHPVVNKRSVDTQEKVHTPPRKQMLRPRNKRHFAVPPEHFQPRAANIRPTTTKPPTFVVKETNAFLVDPVDYYIRVNDTAHIGEHTLIQFYVVLEDDDGVAVSNPLPFIVHVDQPEESSSYPAVPAVFAGVLVLCVIFLAVLIPLVTRAKRRYKQGKPMFKLGSHPSRADLEKAELDNQSNMTRNASEPNWYGNNIYYNYEDEVAKERSDFTRGLRQYSTKSEPPTLQLHKKKKEALTDSSSSSGIDSASQGANGYDGEDSYSQRL